MHEVMEPPVMAAPSKDKVNVEAIARLAEQRTRLIQQISKAIIGQQEVIDNVLLTIFCGGHALIVGVPGLAKTRRSAGRRFVRVLARQRRRSARRHL